MRTSTEKPQREVIPIAEAFEVSSSYLREQADNVVNGREFGEVAIAVKSLFKKTYVTSPEFSTYEQKLFSLTADLICEGVWRSRQREPILQGGLQLATA